MGKIIGAIIVILVIVAGVYYWFNSSKTDVTAPATSPTTRTAPTQTAPVIQNPSTAAPVAGSVREIMVSGNEFAFQPSTLMLKMGEPVKITFKNMGKYPHNFAVADLNVATQTLQPGEQGDVTFTPSKTGTFTYTCTVDSHADKGMKGTVTVQ